MRPVAALFSAAALVPALALAQETTFPASLAGHALIPAATFLTPPADAPTDAQVSGKFSGRGIAFGTEGLTICACA